MAILKLSPAKFMSLIHLHTHKVATTHIAAISRRLGVISASLQLQRSNMNGRTSKKTSILSLPLAPSLPEFLTPDPAFPSVEALLSLSSYSSEHAKSESKPSLLRRSRQVKAHFCYTTPLPLTFVSNQFGAAVVLPLRRPYSLMPSNLRKSSQEK